MKKITITMAFAFCLLSLMATGTLSNDTTFQYKDKHIKVVETSSETLVKVYKIDENGDTIWSEKVYEGVFADDRVIEREYNRFEISIPEVLRPKRKKSFDPHWGGFGIGFSNLPEQLNFDGELASVVNPGSSLQYNLNFGDAAYRFGLNNFRLVTGIGIQFNSIHLQTNKAIEVVDYKSVITTTDPGFNYKTSRLHFTYLTFPVLLEYNTLGSSSARFFINGGLVMKVKTASSSKVWFYEDSRKRKMKMPGELNIRPVTFDFIAQIGFGDYGIFATYSPLDLFMDGKGPKGNQVSIGLQYYP